MNSLAGISLHGLQTILLFGVGALFLYILVPVALFANEVRLAKQGDDTSGTSSVLNAMVQAFFFIISWLTFVTMIVFLLVGVGDKETNHAHKVETNPAVGIYRYWDMNWTNPALINTLDTAITDNDKKNQQAETIVFILTSAKMLEYLLLAMFLTLTLKLSMSLPMYKMRRTDHYKMSTNIDVGTLMSFFMVGIIGWIMFRVIITFDEVLLNAVLDYGATKKDLTLIVDKNSPKKEYIDILGGVWKLIQSGITQLNK